MMRGSNVLVTCPVFAARAPPVIALSGTVPPTPYTPVVVPWVPLIAPPTVLLPAAGRYRFVWLKIL